MRRRPSGRWSRERWCAGRGGRRGNRRACRVPRGRTHHAHAEGAETGQQSAATGSSVGKKRVLSQVARGGEK